jgi:hypothetical protein
MQVQSINILSFICVLQLRQHRVRLREYADPMQINATEE